MKRKIFISMLISLTIVCLFGCSSKKEDTDVLSSEMTEAIEIEATTEPQTEVTTEDEALKAEMERQQYLQDLYKYYGDCLKGYHSDDEYGDPHFLICDLNDNGIPELYIGNGNHRYADDFEVCKMYVDIDTEIELESNMEMYDGSFHYWDFVETQDGTREYIFVCMQLNDDNELKQTLKYSNVQSHIAPIDYGNDYGNGDGYEYDYEGGYVYQNEYYIFDENGNKIKSSEDEIEQFTSMTASQLKSIYKAYDLSNSNIMALKSGKLEWNVQPSEEEYFSFGRYKMPYGLYQGNLTINGEDGKPAKNYITFNNDGTFELTKNKEPSYDEKKQQVNIKKKMIIYVYIMIQMNISRNCIFLL